MGELTPPRGTNELAGLVHLPHKSIASPILMRSTQRLKTVADFMTKPEGICLGVNEHYDTTKDVYLPENLRSRHLYIVGASGSGKSTLLTNVIKQDLEAGAGFAVVDPHGDLVEDVLARVPSERTGDVIYFNPADREYITPLSILAARSPEEQILVADALIVTFRRLVESWGEAAQASGMAERFLSAFAPKHE